MVRVGAREEGEEEREDRPPRPSRSRGLPPAPGPALPTPGPMASFIPPWALYKYLPSAHHVSCTWTDAAGVQREESEAALPSRDSHLEVAKVRLGNLWAVAESTREGARESEKAPRRWSPLDLALLSSFWNTSFAPVMQSPLFTPTRLPALLPWPFLLRGRSFPAPPPSGATSSVNLPGRRAEIM